MSGPCIPLPVITPAEKRTMDSLMSVYTTRARRSDALPGEASKNAIRRDIANPHSVIGATIYEMNLEIVARKAANFTSRNTFKNKVLGWTNVLRQSGSSLSMGGRGPYLLEWLEGIVDFYKEAITALLTSLGSDFDIAALHTHIAATTAGGGGGGFANHVYQAAIVGSISDHEIRAIIDRAETCVKSDLCDSPDFIRALKLIPEFKHSYSIAEALTHTCSDAAEGGVVSKGYSGLATIRGSQLSHVLSDSIKGPEWLFCLFAMLLGALRLHHLKSMNPTTTTATTGGGGGDMASGGGGDNTNAAIVSAEGTGAASITSAQLSSTLTSLTEFIMRTAPDRLATHDTVLCATLRYVRSACLLSFPQATTAEQLAAVEALLSSTDNDNSNKGAGRRQWLTLEEYRSQPLFRAVTRDMPDLVDRMQSFLGTGALEPAWVQIVMYTQLFRFDPTKNRRIAPGSASARIADVTGVVPPLLEHVASSTVAVKDSMLYHILVAYLRPLFRQLLLCEPPHEGGDGAAVVVGSGGIVNISNSNTDAADGALLLTASQASAREALNDLLCAADRVVMPRASKMRKWDLMDLGEQPILEERFGERCLGAAMDVVLGDVMRDALVWLTQPLGKWAETKLNGDASKIIPDELGFVFYKYLVRTEKYYHALTDPSVKVRLAGGGGVSGDGAANTTATTTAATTALAGTAAAAAAGSAAPAWTICIEALQRFKSGYCAAASDALNSIYPLNGGSALILPVVNSTHNYLLRSEEREGSVGVSGPGMAAGSGPGGGGGGAPRPAMAKLAPRPPGGGVAPGPRKMMPGHPQGGKGPGGPSTGATASPAPETFLELRSEAEFQSALRLVSCIRSRDLFFPKYSEMLRARLLFRPAPGRLRDVVFDLGRRTLELKALEYLSITGGECDELMRMRDMANGLEPQYFTTTNTTISGGGGGGGDVKLVVSVLDWRSWGREEEGSYLVKHGTTAATATPTTSNQGSVNNGPHIVDMAHYTGMPGPSEPLPFPQDVWSAVSEYQTEYQQQRKGRLLRWFAATHCNSTFTIAFPKDAGRATTIHGTLLLQQLILAISQYRRVGVSYATLANRTGTTTTADGVCRALAPLVGPGKPLVLVKAGDGNNSEERVALNYDYTRPPNNRTGEYPCWKGCRRFATKIDIEAERKAAEARRLVASTSIVHALKAGRQMDHRELFEKVKQKVGGRFILSSIVFKQAVEGLVEKDYVRRAEDAEKGEVYCYQA